MARKGPEKLGRYKLLTLLATGGMAEIYLARQTGIGGFERLVVVKRILPHLAGQERFVEMFFDEARIAAQLNHPNIVQIFDLGQDEDEYFISMEYLEGESLGYLVREARRTGNFLPVDVSAGIVAQVCDGLDYAHKLTDESGKPLNIVHRDVSPHNIIVLFLGSVKLVDFGIAKAASKMHQTRVGTLKGKLTYMPPEQCLAQPVDGRSDIFSLGVVLWELLTRRRLFKRESEAAMIQAILTDIVPPVRQINPEVTPGLEKVVAKALQRDPEKRFQSAGEMGAAIRDSLREKTGAAGIQEIAAFVDEVLGERARTKRRVLQELKDKGSGEISLGELKPDTDESLPSRSNVEDAATDVRSPDDEGKTERSGQVLPRAGHRLEEEAPTAKRKRPAVRTDAGKEASPLISVLKFVVPLFLVAAIVFLWLISRESTPRTPVAGPPPAFPAADAGPLDAGAAEPDGGAAGTLASEETIPGDAGVVEGQEESAVAKPVIVRITSRPPGCRIEIDSIEVPGQTPIDDLAVDPVVEHEAAVMCRGHERKVKTFSGNPDEEIDLEFVLKRSSPPRPRTGSLRLNTVPWSEVFFGRRKLGMTPLLGVKLPAGRHTLKAVNRAKGLEKKFSVVIQPGKTTTLRIKLED